MGIGELSGLLAAFSWAVSSLYWSKIHLPAISLNLHKNVLGTFMLLVHLSTVSFFFQSPMFTADLQAWALLAVSGGIGIVLGDTFFFRSLQILGPGRALMITVLAPFFAAVLGWLTIGESLTWIAYSGIGMTMMGIVVVLRDKQADDKFQSASPGNFYRGIVLGILGSLCQASGGVLSKFGADGCPGVEAAFIRIFCSSVIIVTFVACQRKILPSIAQLKDKVILQRLLIATAVGTWLGIWLSLVAFIYCPVAVAQTTLSVCPLFAIPIGYFINGQRVTYFAVAGIVISIVGVYLTLTRFS